jgi:hypothetical protein
MMLHRVVRDKDSWRLATRWNIWMVWREFIYIAFPVISLHLLTPSLYSQPGMPGVFAAVK